MGIAHSEVSAVLSQRCGHCSLRGVGIAYSEVSAVLTLSAVCALLTQRCVQCCSLRGVCSVAHSEVCAVLLTQRCVQC